MRKFDLMTVLGFILGFSAIITSIFLGGNLELYWNVPSVLITIGGSFAALLVSYDFSQIKGVMYLTRKVLFTEPMSPGALVEIFAELARKARREGLLGLEEDIWRLDDPFFQKGVRMMVDAIEPDLIRNILRTDMEAMVQRHQLGQKVFRTWGVLSPAFGMVGTLIGLINMLSHLEDPGSLGPAMAVALLTTFYGMIMANLVFNPIANKLELRSDEELLLRNITLEGVISIQSGMNPRILEEKLRSFLPASVIWDVDEGNEESVNV